MLIDICRTVIIVDNKRLNQVSEAKYQKHFFFLNKAFHKTKFVRYSAFFDTFWFSDIHRLNIKYT